MASYNKILDEVDYMTIHVGAQEAAGWESGMDNAARFGFIYNIHNMNSQAEDISNPDRNVDQLGRYAASAYGLITASSWKAKSGCTAIRQRKT